MHANVHNGVMVQKVMVAAIRSDRVGSVSVSNHLGGATSRTSHAQWCYSGISMVRPPIGYLIRQDTAVAAVAVADSFTVSRCGTFLVRERRILTCNGLARECHAMPCYTMLS